MARDYPLAAYAAQESEGQAHRHASRSFSIESSSPNNFRGLPCHRCFAEQSRRNFAAIAIVSRRKNRCCPNGIDAARFAHAENNFDRRKFLGTGNCRRSSLLVGTVGELTPLKGQAEFLKAAAGSPPIIRMLTSSSPAQIILEKPDPERGSKDLIKHLNLDDRVRAVRWVEDIVANILRPGRLCFSVAHGIVWPGDR